MAVALRWLRAHAVAVAIAAAAIVVAWLFAWTTLRHTRPMGLPLDDSYIYLTYAKMAGRGHPFTYFPGGGYSAGSTSVLWPLLLAPFWTLGARGHALVWVSFLMCAALFAWTAVGVYRIARQFAGERGALVAEVTGASAAVVTLAIGPFAWGALSGMEVAFASALLVSLISMLLAQPRTGRPRAALIACLAATSLSRPELTMIAGGVIAVAAFARVRQRDVAAAAWWCAPLIAPLAWVTANRALAGHWFPNTGVVKSHFYLPGFDWSYWLGAVGGQLGHMVRVLFLPGDGPFVLAPLFAIAWCAGAVRIVRWARARGTPLAGALIVAAPWVLLATVIATFSGPFDIQNFRYVAPVFPMFALVAACALVAPAQLAARARRAWTGVAGVVAVAFAAAGAPAMRDQMLLFAQGAMDTNTQVVAIGERIGAELPDATVMFHDAGAVAYYGDTRVYDMLGLITNFQAEVANNGPGSRFEFLESLPPEQRPTQFAYYPDWMGTREFFGAQRMSTPLRPALLGKLKRLAGDADMQLFDANWDHVGTAERPFLDHPGWALVDRVDVADIASEHAHRWRGRLGRRNVGDPTAKWSLVERETKPAGLVIDGGRTIRSGGEQFVVAIDPHKPTRLVLRSGGARGGAFDNAVDQPASLEVYAVGGGAENIGPIARQVVPAPAGGFVEVTFDLPPGTVTDGEVRIEASAPYRAFHWFVLQPQ